MRRIEWKCHKKHGVERRYQLESSNLDLARDLSDILGLFYKITLQILISASSCLSNIVIFINQITNHLCTAIHRSKYPPALRNACQLGLKLTNKYYSLTDNSPLYQITICESFSDLSCCVYTTDFFLFQCFTHNLGMSISSWQTGNPIG